MKKKISLLLLQIFCFGTILLSQTYQVTYNEVKNFSGVKGFEERYKSELSFNTKEWINYSTFIETGKPKGEHDIDLRKKTKFEYIHFPTKEIVIETDTKGKYTFIKDSLIVPKWEIILDSTKLIGDYVCSFAKTEYLGRFYEVWYANDIVSNAGPWRLCSLPGLILEAKSLDGVYNVTFVSLKKVDDKLILKPKITPEVNKKEFLIHIQKEMAKLKRDMKSIISEDRNSDISFDMNYSIPDLDKTLNNENVK